MNYSILINTCDKFEDCWDPFFKLWSLYWKDCTGKIYLNTEYKGYSYPGLDITAIKGCEKHHIPKNKRATWSQCLKWALEEMDTDIVLYMQEDYFLNAPVNTNLFNRYLELITNEPLMHCLHLSPAAGGSGGSSQYEHIDVMKKKYRYRVGCQAALWKRDILLSYIKERESAWDFEEFASERARYIPHNFYLLNKDWLQKNPVLPYLATGIIQGRWWEPVASLFEQHNITLDFSKRGFVKDAPPKPISKRIDYRIHKIPKLLIHYFELLHLRIKHKN